MKETSRVEVENKWFIAAAAILFALTLWWSDGSLYAAFGILSLILLVGYVSRRLATRAEKHGRSGHQHGRDRA